MRQAIDPELHPTLGKVSTGRKATGFQGSVAPQAVKAARFAGIWTDRERRPGPVGAARRILEWTMSETSNPRLGPRWWG